MSRIHDMGGRFGEGSVPDMDDNVVFHSDWEARAMANTVLAGGLGAWNIDAGRHARESLMPRDYARFSYYEKWLAALANILVARGVLSEDDLRRARDLAEGRAGNEPSPLSDTALRAADVLAAQRKITPYTRDGGAAAHFKTGDKVRTADYSPNHRVKGGHTRLPAYAMGRVGTVVLLHGTHVLPDSNAHFEGEAPEPLYGVEFDAATLWGRDADNPADKVVLDLWQNYLTAVEE
ncbi:MAG: nitrile hydratase subunit beta [Alphaproteobacteria bacterium]|nr:nitrile hydratase subunit beta [Alphaproteobacteria bacterium]